MTYAPPRPAAKRPGRADHAVTPRSGRRVLLLGASGGVGTTVLAAALAARAARRGARSIVLERSRGGLDVVCGVDGWPGVRADDLRDLDGPPDGERLVAGLPRPAGVAVLAYGCDLSGPALDDEQLGHVLDAVGSVCDVVVVDAGAAVPEGLLPVVDELLVVTGGAAHQLGRAASLCAALAGASTLPATTRVVLTRTRLDPLVVAERLGVDTGHAVGHDASVARDLEAAALPGRHGRGALARGADALLDEIGVRRRSGRRARH